MRSEGLSTAIYTSFDELASVRDEWDEFIEHSGSDIYFTFDWLETWWKYYGRNHVLRCFASTPWNRLKIEVSNYIKESQTPMDYIFSSNK